MQIRKGIIWPILALIASLMIFSCGERQPQGDAYGPILLSDADSIATYLRADKSPEFEGGSDALLQCIVANLLYPEEALAKRVQGKVMLSFVVDTNGQPVDFEIVRDLGFGCDEAAINAIKACNGWRPGIVDGKAVRTKMSMPVEFRL